MSRTKVQKEYITYMNDLCLTDIKKKYEHLLLFFSGLKRKKEGSNNSLKNIIKLASKIYSFEELLEQTRIKKKIGILNPDFSYEKQVLNDKLLDYVKLQMSKRRKCKKIFFGENLLNAYCDVIFLATNLDDNRMNNIRPKILMNHTTGRAMEFDIFFEKIKFALEFQGEQHYTNENIIKRDRLKLNLSKENCIMLSPINPVQMPNANLLKLIANSAKDFYRMSDKNGDLIVNEKTKYKTLFKVIQRYDLAESLFVNVLEYLDNVTKDYIKKIKNYSPVSTTHDAPRMISESGDKNITTLKRQIPRIHREIRNKKKLLKNI